jgi:hypothetical protein
VLSRPVDGDVATGTWTITTEKFAGPRVPSQARVYSKLHWVPALKSLAFYGDVVQGKASGAVYLYRPQGS